MAFHLRETIEVVKKQEDGVSPMYYKAIILVITGQRYLVLYETRHADNPQRNLLQEWVDEADIRPTPINLPFQEYYQDEAVDVFSGDAWRFGKIVGKRDNSNYNVRLDGSVNCEVVSTHVSRIRFHLDRVNGAWVSRADDDDVDYDDDDVDYDDDDVDYDEPSGNQPGGSEP